MPAPVVIVGVNSWTSIAWADDYFLAKYGAGAWAGLTVTEKTQLLLSAVRWILQQNTFDLPMSATAEIVRQGQCEAAWFIYSWFGEYEKRRALSSMGVTDYKILDFSETLSGVEFPAFLAGMLDDYSLVKEHQFPRLNRDVEDNAGG